MVEQEVKGRVLRAECPRSGLECGAYARAAWLHCAKGWHQWALVETKVIVWPTGGERMRTSPPCYNPVCAPNLPGHRPSIHLVILNLGMSREPISENPTQ